MATVTLIGKTFQHRETIKTLGGKWDGAAWKIINASDETVKACRELIGVAVNVLGDMPAAPAPAKPVIERPAVAPITDGRVVSYGDDLSHFPFAKGTPRVRVGFSSLNKLCDFVETTPAERRSLRTSQGAYGFATSEAKWRGSANMGVALDIARNGWADGVALASKALEIIEADHVTARERIYSVAGGRVNVGKMLAGSPLHMSRRSRVEGRKVITLYVSIDAPSIVDPETMIIKAAAVAAMADLLEQSGYSCEIVGTKNSRRSDKTSIVQASVVLKRAADPLNINDVVFGLGHPSMLRRLMFAVINYDPAASAIQNSTMGYPGDAFDDDTPPPSNSFYLSHININPRGDFTAKVRAIFKAIVPDNFPVTLK